ncbi:MAG: hypothetical protein OXI54_12390 [Chloroflexota bacterium]|nr:hypothetical protein [Chloroflexota bacterium]MDE2684931.1 hypothetical protein [Chloroflexota bacterium]
MEQWFMLIIDIFQTISSVVLSSVAIVLAVMVYRIQRDRNRAKLMLTDELIEDDERGEPAQGIRIRNVGLVRAVNIKLLADIEEWKDDQLLNSKFHERFDAYSDNLAVLEPQESRLYELPTPEDRDYIITVIAQCKNGTGDHMRFHQLGSQVDHKPGHGWIALRRIKKGRKAAIKRLERLASGKSPRRGIVFVMGVDSMKDHDSEFGGGV